MKKLSTLMLVMLVSAGMAFAQNNSADVTQNGNGNNAEVTQTGSDNDATSIQTGNNSDVFITQTGADNDAFARHSGSGVITQLQTGDDNNAYSRASSSGVTFQQQIGNGNDASIAENRGSINQSSFASQIQTGDNNEAFIDIRQGNGRLNTLLQAQVGDYNRAEMLDVGNGNFVDQFQQGYRNLSTVGNSSNPQLGGMTVFTSQFGDDNTATVWGSQNDIAVVTQTGDWNTASVIQTAGNDFAIVTQTGNWNTASVIQSN